MFGGCSCLRRELVLIPIGDGGGELSRCRVLARASGVEVSRSFRSGNARRVAGSVRDLKNCGSRVVFFFFPVIDELAMRCAGEEWRLDRRAGFR